MGHHDIGFSDGHSFIIVRAHDGALTVWTGLILLHLENIDALLGGLLLCRLLSHYKGKIVFSVCVGVNKLHFTPA
jgi:hypothetical protein